MRLFQCIVTGHTSFRAGNGIRSQSDAAVFGDIRVIAQHNSIFNIFCIRFDWNLFFDSIFETCIWIIICKFTSRVLCLFSDSLFFRSHGTKDNIVLTAF